jgi:hypothetical protein
MLDDVAMYLIVAPAAAGLFLIAAAVLWVARWRPARARAKIAARRRR